MHKLFILSALFTGYLWYTYIWRPRVSEVLPSHVMRDAAISVACDNLARSVVASVNKDTPWSKIDEYNPVEFDISALRNATTPEEFNDMAERHRGLAKAIEEWAKICRCKEQGCFMELFQNVMGADWIENEDLADLMERWDLDLIPGNADSFDEVTQGWFDYMRPIRDWRMMNAMYKAWKEGPGRFFKFIPGMDIYISPEYPPPFQMQETLRNAVNSPPPARA